MAMVLALHELSTNAVKYGALSVSGGHVVIDWHVAQHAGKDMLEFRWQEVGGPAVAEKPKRRGFGSRLIEKVLSSELDGKGELAYLPTGLVFTLVAPLPDQDKINGTPDDEEMFRRGIGDSIS
jgi:two-component sensor histidine kinase